MKKELNNKRAMARTLKTSGSMYRLAKNLNESGYKVSNQNVAIWFKTGKIPAHWCVPVCLTVGFDVVTPQQLRPDVFCGSCPNCHAG